MTGQLPWGGRGKGSNSLLRIDPPARGLRGPRSGPGSDRSAHCRRGEAPTLKRWRTVVVLPVLLLCDFPTSKPQKRRSPRRPTFQCNDTVKQQ